MVWEKSTRTADYERWLVSFLLSANGEHDKGDRLWIKEGLVIWTESCNTNYQKRQPAKRI